MEETRAFDGVPVREGAALDTAVPSCFVGDLVGDCEGIIISVVDSLYNQRNISYKELYVHALSLY